MIRTLLLSILAVSLTFAVAYGDDPNVADVPVTKIVLFSSGVGYFEHDGEVDDDAVVELSFRAPQINDVLKSMLVMDLSGEGTVTGINYASRDPLIRALKSFAVDLSDDPELGELLSQLRGAEVTVQAPDDVQGRILGLEQQQKVLFIDGSTTLIVETILNLMTEDGIQALPLSTIQGVELADERLADELSKALDVLLTANDTERKPVRINFAGEGERDVRIGYVVETPIWKTSYRLDLSGETPRIQGWAIVENTSDADWTDVQLSLVSGQPISFIENLYTPLYLPRKIYSPRGRASLTPQTYDQGVEPPEWPDEGDVDNLPTLREEEEEEGAGGGFLAESPPEGYAPEELSLEDSLVGTVRALAAGSSVGELFEFTVSEPVTLARRQSAMLPLIASGIDAEPLSVYDPDVLSAHPLTGARITNNTELKLPPGSITVLTGGVYAGDASIYAMNPGDRRLISYGVDQKIRAEVEEHWENTTNTQTAIFIRDGALHVLGVRRTTVTYTFHNADTRDRDILVATGPQYAIYSKLVQPETFEEKTFFGWRVRVTAPAGETTSLDVVTDTAWHAVESITAKTPDQLWTYVENQDVPEDVHNALANALKLRREQIGLEEAVKADQARREEIFVSQQRLRDNLQTIDQDSSLGKRYLAKLNEQEDELEAIDAEIDQATERIQALKEQLEELLDGLVVGKPIEHKDVLSQ